MRAGDRLLCKKTTSYNIMPNKYKNNVYIITKITDDDMSIYFNKDWFSLNKESGYYIWDYFYTAQEVRKMKLERLKQCLK